MGKLDQLFGLLRFAANDQLLVHVGTRGMPGALENTDLRPHLDPWVRRDGVSRPPPHLVYLGISQIGYVRQRDFAMTELLSETVPVRSSGLSWP